MVLIQYNCYNLNVTQISIFKDFDLTDKKIDPTYSERTDQQLDTRPKCNTLDYNKMYIQCDYIVILQHFTDSALVA